MKKIVHIITGLGSGGAENMLYKLLKYLSKDQYYHEVISLMDNGVYGDKIEKLGIKVHCLNLNKKNIFRSLMKIKSICNEFDIIDTWLYHADILGFIVSKVLLNKKLIWNIRHSNLNKDANKASTLNLVKINCFLSKYVDLITYNSNKALKTHTKIGYLGKNSKVIPNGFELDEFKFNPYDRIKLRKELGVGESKVIITVGRWNVQKDYYTLLKALYKIKNKNLEFKMIMVGTNLESSNQSLTNLISQYNLESYIILLGRRTDIPSLLSASDIYVSSSLGESFSNSIGEAMACELPCIATDVGDSRVMVGDTGEIVEAQNYTDLSNKLFDYIIDNELTRNKESRRRVFDNYDIKKIVKIFEQNFKLI